MNQIFQCRSGEEIPKVTRETANARRYLSESTLQRMHLMANGNPIAYSEEEDGKREYYFDPQNVKEAPPELWYEKKAPVFAETVTLEDGTVVGKLSVKQAAKYGYYTKERLADMHYETAEKPVAYAIRRDGAMLLFYDKAKAVRLPLTCVKCGQDIRYKRKLCKKCYEEDMAIRRAEGDLHRAAEYHMKREKVLFFDLELTGVYDHDEILSISIVDGTGKTIMDTLVRPVHNKKWKRTEKIHGITPEMVVDAPTLSKLTPEIKRIFADAENLIAYGISTDFSHIKKIYETEKEQEALRKKTRCAANEYVRYIQEHAPEESHASLTDAMAYLGIEWDGTAHTSIADTIGCAKVWEKLFPNYYEN